ncbi:hypothetical protein FXN61_09005 [Lentzea sp. PSKA42]|uniref:PknH-like extracellular domain-containing protein n=1 Tax=Lentzea indica TaxID=2604800 RepID=A0ABX1FDP1_9PSEU|nr:hypothetical protein [Lentzea indica]
MTVLLAGCTAQEAAPPSSPPPVSSSAVSVPDQWNQLAGRALSAYVAKEEFGPDAPWKEDQPAAPGGYEHGTPDVAGVCGGVKIGSGFKVTRSRLWRGDTVVWQNVHALSSQKAAELVEQIREKSRTCSAYPRKEGKPTRAVTPDAAVTPPAGFDGFYAFCETAPDVAQGQDNCQAYLARGDLLVVYGSNAVSEDPNAARLAALRQLQQMTPPVAKALAAV